MRTGRLLLAILPIVLLGPRLAPAQESDDLREQKVVERFAALLEKSPRRGTALDRVYGFHVERGTLDAFLKSYRDRVAGDPRDGPAWMVLGLVEAHRGRDAAAVAAFKEAEKARPDDPLPAYYEGQSLVLVGQPDQAALAFERALARQPARQDRLDIFQSLGRVYQRAHRNDQALAVWDRLEAAFPDDARVREQIADILAEEGQVEPALARYESLSRTVKDPYRQVQLRLQAAELKVRLGRPRDALADFEGLLSRLEPESWLAREVRRQVEDVFLRNDDLAGLSAYYQDWIKKAPEDVEALARLGRTLAQQGRAAEARPWLEKAVKLAPRRRDLRLALIEQLVRDKKVAEAEAQYEALSRAEPNNPDVIREWGRLVLHDPSRPEAKRKDDAAAVWKRLLNGREKDPVAVAQLADLDRQAGLVEPALELYRKAVELAPDAPQYREYLGEYLHTLQRTPEAMAAWRGMSEGTNRSARTLARLAEVLSGFGHRAEALEPLTEAIALQPDDFELRVKQADLLLALERYDDALPPLDEAARLADGDEARELVLERQIKAYQGAKTLRAQIEALQNDLDAGREATAARWRRLARFLEADQKLPEAVSAAKKAVALDERSVPAWATLARIVEASGDLGAAADAQRRLSALDRRGRADYLTSIAKLESRLGRREAALQAGRDLLAATPGNPDTHQFFADLCFQLGATDEGLDALRRAVRANPSDPKGLLTLADALAQQFRTDEAIELCWRAFERTKELDGKLGIVSRLTELSLQQNQFDKLLARLERLGQEPAQQREGVFCLAQAYSSSGDFGTARQTLERLLTPDTRDPKLFEQLSSLSESEGDVAGAAKYLRQACDLAPDDKAWDRLAQLYLRSGDAAEAEAIWGRIADSDRSQPARALQAIDSLLSHSQRETVLAITERLLRADPKNWEALYREGVALAGLGRNEDAAKRFQALLDLRLNDDEEGALAKAFKRNMPSNTTARPAGTAANSGATTTTLTTRLLSQPPILSRHTAATYIRRVTGLDYYPIAYNWSPTDFGQARMTALGWLDNLSQKDKTNAAFLRERREAANRATQDLRALWDWYYLELVRQENRDAYLAARELTRRAPSDLPAQFAYLYSLRLRTQRTGPVMAVRAGSGVLDTTPPLDSDEIDHVLACYESLRKRRPEWLQFAFLSNITSELKRAKRDEDQARMLREAVETANDPLQIYSALLATAERGDLDTLFALLDRIERTQSQRSIASTPYLSMSVVSRIITQAMSVRADAKAHGDILRLLDRFDAYQRRFQATGTRARATASTSPASSYYVLAGSGGILRSITFDFPLPVEAFDFGSIQALRNAFELYRRDDLLSDLFAHIRARREKGDDAQRLHTSLALTALLWWNDQKDESAKVLGEAAEQAKNDPEIRLLLAELRERRNEPEEALAILDSVEPIDNATMQKRETSALRLAVQAGNVERARLAAERLFGLRLDAETQVQLAAQMHQLGQHELAEAVLARARRRAGNRVAALVSLMGQYQRQNQPDLAVQVAHQILRRGPSATANQPGYYSEDDAARTQALQVLGRSGKLKEMIARVEAQAKASPQSVALLQNLADYYRAANDQPKLRATYEAIAKLRPDDAPVRLQIGLQLLQSGDAAAALDHLRAAIKKEPALFGRQYFQFDNAFRQARKSDELMALIEGMDVRQLGNYSYAANVAQNLMANPQTRDRGMKLFRRIWDAFPSQRMYMLQYIHDEQVWQLPEMYDFARQAVVPDPDRTQVEPWGGFDLTGYENDARVNSALSRLLDAAARQGKVADLSRDVEEALKRIPDWTGGKVLLALLQLREGKSAEAVAALKSIVEDRKIAIPGFCCWPIAQELENFGPATELAEAFYKRAMDEDISNRGLRYPTHPARRLSLLYQRAGKVAEARALLLKVAGSSSDSSLNSSSNLNPGLDNGQHALMLGTIAEQLLDLDDPADAVRFLGQMMGEIEKLPEDNRFYPSREMLETQYRRGIDRAFKGLGPEARAATVTSLLAPRPEARAGGPVLDLILVVEPRELDRAAVTSLLALTLPSAARTPEARAEVEATLARLADEFPHDLSVPIAGALLALAEGKAEAIDRAVGRLAERVEQTPLDDLPAGTKANARQRAEAARQLGLWLVARGCWAHESARASGDLFARRALEAARRQGEPRWALAMLREWGRIDLDRGDRAAAEGRWGQMLDLVLANPQPARTKPGPNVPPATPAPPAPGGLQSGSSARGSMVPAFTLDRFEQPAQVARLAARQGMHALTLRAVRESLQGGPPVAAARPGQGFGTTTTTAVRVIGRIPETNAPDPGPARVESLIADLDRTWDEKQAPALDVYETLRDVVLPRARPSEVFLYARPFLAGDQAEPRSVGAVFGRWAVRAGRSEELRRQVEARRGQPLGELPATVLLAQLGLAGKDEALTRPALEAIGERLKKDTLQTSAETACLAALPALRVASLAKPAGAVLDLATKNLATRPGEEPPWTLYRLLARQDFTQGRAEEGRKRLEAFLAATDRTIGGASVEYLNGRRRQHYLVVAAEYARAGLWPDVLEILGRLADAPASASDSQTPIGPVLAGLALHLQDVPAPERYERLLAWTLPTTNRQSVHMLGAFIPEDAPPPAFAPSLGRRDFNLPPSCATGVASISLLLIDAAREAGRLDALADALKEPAARKVENAEPLALLVEIARGRGRAIEPRLRPVLEAIRKKRTTPADPSGRPATVAWDDYLLARACLFDGGLAPLGQEMTRELEAFARLYDADGFLVHLRRDRAARPEPGLDVKDRAGRDPGLALWHPSSHALGLMGQSGGKVPALWVEAEGNVAHLAGPQQEFLLFDLPLTGSFEFTVEARHGDWGEEEASYAGLLFAQRFGRAWDVGESIRYRTVSRSRIFPTFVRPRDDDFKRLTIAVTPGKVRFLINGRLFQEEADPSPTSPWLALASSRDRRSYFRNPRITGTPEIPREVRLTHADRLDGWGALFYGESKASSRKEDAAGVSSSGMFPQGDTSRRPEDHDWRAHEGVIIGRRIDPSSVLDANAAQMLGNTVVRRNDPGATDVESRLFYQRPIRVGETLSYEFFYEAGTVTVHPALGREVFLLEPEGVRLHWMTDGGGRDRTGLEPGNAVEEPGSRRGPKALPLKPGDWNAVVLKVGDDSVTIILNGTTIVERPIEPGNDRLFSLFHFKDRTEARARAVVLRGAWPDRLPDVADLFRRSTEPDRIERRARQAIVGEGVLASDAARVLREARDLPPAERFERLARWVVPGPDHDGFRLQGDFTTANPAPPVAPKQEFAPGARRVRIGGALEAPALDLLAVARDLGRLDDLATRVREAEARSDLDRRGRLALEALIAIGRGRDDEAEGRLKQLAPLVETLAKDSPTWMRWPELLAATRALDRPALRGAALSLLDLMSISRFEKDAHLVSWDQHVRQARALGEWLGTPESGRRPFGSDPGLKWWSPVMHDRASTRGEGAPVANWTVRVGEVAHDSGHPDNALYLDVPLRGDFEVNATLASFNGRLTRLSYGDVILGIRPDGRLRESPPNTVPPLEKEVGWYAYRLVVRDGTCTAYVDGKKAGERSLARDADPWLALTISAPFRGGARGLAIAGNPIVPEALSLSSLPDLAGWRADYHAEPVAGAAPSWEKRGEEIFGRLAGDVSNAPQPDGRILSVATIAGPTGDRRKSPAIKQESVLQYHRPIREDGAIEYEFYYEPDRVLVHPALDRLAFLLEPGGVAIHWLTDDPHDRTGLAPDNRAVEPDRRRGPSPLPLKPRDWNRMKVQLAGDTLSLTLNGELIYERPLEPTNQRTFGLFRHADETEARVRNVSYRGDWPKSLPAADELLSPRTSQ